MSAQDQIHKSNKNHHTAEMNS